MEWNNKFDGEIHSDPRSELLARANRAENIGDSFVAVPVALVQLCMSIRECEARTIVNGNRMDKVLVEVKCTRLLDPVTGSHNGVHVNGRANWR